MSKKDKKIKKDKKKNVKKDKQDPARLEKKLLKLEDGIKKRRMKIIELNSKLSGMTLSDYTLKDRNGNDVSLSSLFGDKTDMVLIHNMGRNCSYCSMWADGFNGIYPHIQKRAAFVLVSPDTPEAQREFADNRGWKFPMYSAANTTFIKDLGFQTEAGDYWPGASILHKENGTIKRVNKTFFGPGDFFCSVWHFFDMIPKQEEEQKL